MLRRSQRALIDIGLSFNSIVSMFDSVCTTYTVVKSGTDHVLGSFLNSAILLQEDNNVFQSAQKLPARHPQSVNTYCYVAAST